MFSETYTFNCSREERESDQVNLVDRGTVKHTPSIVAGRKEKVIK